MSQMWCPRCDEEIDVDDPWDAIVEERVIICPSCAARLQVWSDESYNPETGDEWVWTYLDDAYERKPIERRLK